MYIDSGWIVQVQPTNEADPIASLNPTHGSGWIVQVQPTNEADPIASLNPTHGSGWIVQVQPTSEADPIASLNPTHGSGGSFKSSLRTKPTRWQWVDRSSPAYTEGRLCYLSRGAR